MFRHPLSHYFLSLFTLSHHADLALFGGDCAHPLIGPHHHDTIKLSPSRCQTLCYHSAQRSSYYTVIGSMMETLPVELVLHVLSFLNPHSHLRLFIAS
jgi:hypothetical protein